MRVELVGDQIGGYAIQRGDTMMLFFPREEVADSANALLAIAHELAHLAVREASQARPVPQWFNEGFAAWVSQAVLAERFPDEAAAQRAIDRAVIASALHRRIGLLPWADLVGRAEFSRAGTEGWTYLTYGQSTLVIAWLAERRGAGALGAFLKAIGAGQPVSQAYQAELGSFTAQTAGFEASLAELAAEFPPGLHLLTSRVRAGQKAAIAVVGGSPSERVSTAVRSQTGPELRFEQTLDAAGFLTIMLPTTPSTNPGLRSFTVDSPTLGRLEAVLLIEPPADAGPAPAPAPAPVQLPRRVGLWRGPFALLAGATAA